MADLTPKQQRLIELLLQPGYKDRQAVARKLKVSTRTIRRWLQADDFRKSYEAAKRQCYAENLAGISSLTGIAVGELARILADADARHRDKIAAARVVLDHARASVVDDVEAVLQKVEQALTTMEGIQCSGK